MTQQPEETGAGRRAIVRCAWCGTAFTPAGGPGRPARYCRRSHRQRAYEARRLAEARQLGTGEVLVGRDELQRVRDLVYLLETTLDDARIDLDDGADPMSVLAMVVAAARRVAEAPLEPLAAHD